MTSKTSFPGFALIFLYLILHSTFIIAQDSGIDNLRKTSKAFAQVAKQVSPSVVLIRVERDRKSSSQIPYQSPFDDDLFKRFFGDRFPDFFSHPQLPQPDRNMTGQGSGFVFSLDKGLFSETTYILTNSHVVEDADKINVTFQDGRILEAKVTRGYLGIVIQTLTPDLAESFNVRDTQGILVAQVSEDTPAARAGLKPGDLIINYQGQAVTTIGEFRNRVAMTNPGTLVQLTIIRHGKQRVLSIKVGSLADSKLADKGPSQSTKELGITVQTLTPELARQFDIKLDKGVVVTAVSPGAIAGMAGIQPGTVILQVDHKAVNTAKEFTQAIKNRRDSHRVLLLISVKGMPRYVVLSWR